MIALILGKGTGNAAVKVFATESREYEIPSKVFSLMGINNGLYAIDVYRIMLGIWSSFVKESLQKGLNPNYSVASGKKSFQIMKNILSGYITPQTSALVNVSVIDLVKRF